MILGDEFVRWKRWQPLGVKTKILFDFIADGLGENEFAYTRSTERQYGFVEPPSRQHSAHQNVRVQKKTDFPAIRHFPCGLRVRRFDVLDRARLL